VGFYTRADSLKQLPVSNLSVALNKISYPLFSSIQNDNIRLKRGYKEIMQMIIYLISPLLTIMAVLAAPMFRLLFTEKWLPAVPYFQILCLTGILYPLHSYNLNILNVKGRSDLFLKLEIFKKVIIGITIIISIKFGIIGLIWGQVITSVIAFFINTHYSGKFIDYSAWDQIKDIAPFILLAILVGMIVYFFDFQISKFPDLTRLALGSLIGVALYGGLSILFKIKSFQELIYIFKRK
jgi:O-antigen/teichoic acid export membrane protein